MTPTPKAQPSVLREDALEKIDAVLRAHHGSSITEALMSARAALSAPVAQKPGLPSYVFTNPTLRIEALEAALRDARHYLIIPEGPRGTMQELAARIDALLAGSKP